MSEQYLIVNTKILPDFYAKVVEARDLVEPIINTKIQSFHFQKTRAVAKLC